MGLRRAVFDLFGDVAQIDGPSRVNADHNLLKLFLPGEEIAGFDLQFAVVAGKAAGLAARIRGAELHDDGAGSEPVRGKPLGVENHAQLPRLPADDRGFGNVVQLLQGMLQLSPRFAAIGKRRSSCPTA